MTEKKYVLDDDRNPWEMQSWESAPAYIHFIQWRDDTQSLSIRKWADIAMRDNPRNAVELGRRHLWRERKESFVSHNDQALLKRRSELEFNAIEEMYSRHNRIVMMLQQMCTVETARWLHEMAADKNPDLTASPTLPIAEIRRTLEFALNFERLTKDQKTMGESNSGHSEVVISEDVVKKLMGLDDESRDSLAAAMVIDVQ